MEYYLEHRFFMDTAEERRSHAWLNPPPAGTYTKHSAVQGDWFHWRMNDGPERKKESLDEWINRVAPPCITHLLDPDYSFFTNASSIAIAVSSFQSYAGLYEKVFNRTVVTEETTRLFQDLAHMYVLRLRHDLYELPCYIRSKSSHEYHVALAVYNNMFAGIPNVENPPSVDIQGYSWIHPAIPKDTKDVRYFWNKVLRGEPLEFIRIGAAGPHSKDNW